MTHYRQDHEGRVTELPDYIHIHSAVETEDLVPLGPPFAVDAVALAASGTQPSLAQCGQALVRISKIKDAVRYWRGDLLNLSGTLFGEEASQLLDAEVMDEKETREEMRVAKAVAPTTRAHAPTWEHARAVAHIARADRQAAWLDKARSEDWSPRKLASEIGKASEDGKTVMRFWLVVECGSESKRDALADRLEADGHAVKRQEKLKKVPKPKRAKKGPVTAQRKRKAPKASTRRRRA